MAFENFEEAEKYIVKNWDEIYSWWNSVQVQKIRKLYLKDFLTLKIIGLLNGQTLFQIKKNYFLKYIINNV